MATNMGYLMSWSAVYVVSLVFKQAVTETPARMRTNEEGILTFFMETNALHCGTITPANESMTWANGTFYSLGGEPTLTAS